MGDYKESEVSTKLGISYNLDQKAKSEKIPKVPTVFKIMGVLILLLAVVVFVYWKVGF